MPHKVKFDLLDDVDMTSKGDGDVPAWDVASSRYIPSTPTVGGGFTRNWALGCAYTLSDTPNGSYPDVQQSVSTTGATAYAVQGGKLTDGQVGNSIYNTGFWIGWSSGTNIAMRIDLGTARSVQLVQLFGLSDGNNGIKRPTAIKLEHSDDDSTWTTVEDRTGLTSEGGAVTHTFYVEFSFTATSHRYWRVTATRDGSNWLFVSELALFG